MLLYSQCAHKNSHNVVLSPLAVLYYGRRYYQDRKHKQKVYAVDSDYSDCDPAIEQLPSLSALNLEAGVTTPVGPSRKLAFTSQQLFDEEDGSSLVFESKIKPVALDALFTPKRSPKPALQLSNKPSFLSVSSRASLFKGHSSALFPALGLSARSAKVGVEALSVFSPGAAAALADLEDETKDEEPVAMSVAEVAAFKVKLDGLVANQQKKGFGMYASVVSKRLNSALLYIKPHSFKTGMQYLVSSCLDDHNIRVLSRGKYSAEEIQQQHLFDRQFSYMARYAVTAPAQTVALTESESALFQDMFEEEWAQVQSGHRVWNAAEACESLCFSPEQLYDLWKCAPLQLHLRRGLQVCRIDQANATANSALLEQVVEPLYVINGFYPSMRLSYTTSGSPLHYMVIEWEGSQLSWRDLLDKVVGHEDPRRALSGSIRAKLLQQWEELGFTAPPDRRDNGVHVSKSAFEGLVERLVWSKGAVLFTDSFGSRLLNSNIPAFTVQNWLQNPTIQDQGVFDHMHGMDAEECVAKAQSLLGKAIILHACLCLYVYLLYFKLQLWQRIVEATWRPS